MNATAKLYVTPKMIADTDRPAEKRTIACRLVDENKRPVRGFQPTRERQAKLVFGGKLEGMVATVKCSGSFSAADVDADHQQWFGRLYAKLEETKGFVSAPVAVEFLEAAGDAGEVEIELS
jgi:hypothetical protein